MPSKLGVYLCTGCGIGEAVDAAKLAKVATGEYKAPVCRTHAALCGAEGSALIRQDLAAGSVDRIVIGACSSRFKAEVFHFNHGSVLERVNLREHVAWCHTPKDEDTQMLAEDYLRMGIARVQKSEPSEPLSDPVSKAILVIGGGIAGMTAAVESAAAGYSVFLVEKDEELGGRAATSRKQGESLDELIEAALYHPHIRTFCSTEVARIEGQPGNFNVTLATISGEQAIQAGAIVVAAGWKPYDASRLAALGYGLTPDVVTSAELERMAAAGPILRPSNGQPAKSVLFIQCAGSRDPEHLPYCSSACCMQTLTEIGYLRQQDPEAQVYVVYRDMRTPGQYERIYRTVQDHPLNFFTKGDVASVKRWSDGRLAVTVHHTLLGESITVCVDLVVLATGMVPNGSGPDPEPGLSPGSGTAGAAGRLSGFAFRLLPLRDAPHRHLRGRSRARTHGRGAGAHGRHRAPRSKPFNVWKWPPKAAPFIRAAATLRIHPSSCSAAPNASAAPRSAPSARSMRMRRARPSPISTAAGAAASAWAPVPSASFPSRTTRWT